MEINIFKNKNLKINLPTFVDSRALICANSGGGKSYAVRKILEESSNKVMSIILDVEGVELNVLKGAKELIKKNKPIIYLEITRQKEEIINFLKDLGYSIKFYKEDNYLFENETI